MWCLSEIQQPTLFIKRMMEYPSLTTSAVILIRRYEIHSQFSNVHSHKLKPADCWGFRMLVFITASKTHHFLICRLTPHSTHRSTREHNLQHCLKNIRIRVRENTGTKWTEATLGRIQMRWKFLRRISDMNNTFKVIHKTRIFF